MTISDYLKTHGIRQAELARRSGVKSDAISNHLGGRARASNKNRVLFAKVGIDDFDSDWVPRPKESRIKIPASDWVWAVPWTDCPEIILEYVRTDFKRQNEGAVYLFSKKQVAMVRTLLCANGFDYEVSDEGGIYTVKFNKGEE
ncbi:MAG: helix-turn-helix domain-containing protein [Turicibacter sp.]|nr:helix-turn-helix domain-containing protein [Turicibacter sp.]